MGVGALVYVWAWASLGGPWVAAAAKTNKVNPDVYLLPAYLRRVFHLDQQVGEALSLLPHPSSEASRYLEWYRWRVVDAAGAGGLMGEAITGNYLHVYSLLKRVVQLWPAVRTALYKLHENVTCEDQLKYCSEWHEEERCFHEPETMMARCRRTCGGCELTDRVKALRQAERSLPLPPVEALDSAATILAALQQVYNLSMRSLVEGRIFTVVTSVRLSLWDCLKVAKSCESKGMYSHAWVWYQQSLAMTSDPELSGYINGLVLSLVKRHDETWRPDENHLNHQISSGNKLEVVRSTILSGCPYGIQKRSREGMMCHATALGSAFLLLQPAKQEILSLDPLIVMIHDAFTNYQADQLVSYGQGKMAMDDDPERLNTYKLIKNISHPIVQMMVRKVNYFTGLLANNTISTTEFGDNKIRHYGAGGHIGPHVDVRYKHGLLNSPYLYTIGDRLLTFLIYLNKVIAGGSTNFYPQGLSVPPEKGSAVYFYNLKKNGNFDHRMHHSGCPVLLGSKWVGLRWVRDNDNFLTYPCSLDPNE